MTMTGIRHGAREAFLTVGALLGAVCIIVTIASIAFGVKPLVFRSGSMSPAIHTGDLAISQTVDASDLEKGDIVSVINSEGNRVTHRLVDSAAQGKTRQLTLKGDANDAPDAEVYTVTEAERILFDIPKAGYVVNAAASPLGVFVLGAYVMTMLVILFRKRTDDDDTGTSGGRRKRADDDGAPAERVKGGARKAGRKGSRTAARSVVSVSFAAALAVAAPATAAAWTDAVAITGSTFTAKPVPAPVVTCGALGIGSARLQWTAVPGATAYVLHYGTGGATTETVAASVTSKTFSGIATSGVFHVAAEINYGSSTWTSASSNSKNYSVLLFLVSTCT